MTTTKSSKTAKTRTPRQTLSPETDELKALWDVLPHPSKHHVVRLFARRADERAGDFARSLKELQHFAKVYIDRNVYVAPNPTCSTGGTRHSAKDVTHWSYFVVDIDPVEEEFDAHRAAMHAHVAFQNAMPLYRIIPTRPIIIDSGRGMQLWYRLPDLVLDDEMEEGIIKDGRVHRKTARKINGYWLGQLDDLVGVSNGCRIDTSVSDLPRVMRCPGTFNVKTGRPTRFHHVHNKVFTDLPEYMLKAMPATALVDPPSVAGAPGQKWQKVYFRLTRMAQKYLMEGQCEPGRHKVMWHTARKLQEMGVTPEEARKALYRANKLAGKDQELSSEEVDHALKTAYGSA